MKFEARSKTPKATLVIGEIEYKIFEPTIEQFDAFTDEYQKVKDDGKAVSKLMRKFLCSLGEIPENDFAKNVSNSVFTDLFKYVTETVKKN